MWQLERIAGRAALALAVALGPGCTREESPVQPRAQARTGAPGEPRIERLQLRSELLSAFAGEDVHMKAAIVLPKNYDSKRAYPSFYYVHGFGGNVELVSQWVGEPLVRRMAESGEPAMIYVLLDASHAMGHHAFADSANMGPWGSALVEEFVPAVDERYATVPRGSGRFVGGHSSGGWSSLWIQLSHPDAFGGVWATAPDPVDFRDFVGVDIYSFANMYTSPGGTPVSLVYRGGSAVMSLKEFVLDEVKTTPIGGQFYSFDAVFSSRGADGAPRQLFDRPTGAIDREVAEQWRKYDISARLRTQWHAHRDALAGKLHVIVGTHDTYGLHRAVRLLAADLAAVGSDAEFLFVDGRDHSDLLEPHAEHYPEGLQQRIEAEALAKYAKP